VTTDPSILIFQVAKRVSEFPGIYVASLILLPQFGTTGVAAFRESRQGAACHPER
jgi:hypothetical protein